MNGREQVVLIFAIGYVFNFNIQREKKLSGIAGQF